MTAELSGASDTRASLRRLVEERLDRETAPVQALSAEEALLLVHELQTHQIELELQNEELRRSQEDLTRMRDRYAHLYDSAPVGYLTLSAQGRIEAANLTAASLLGVTRNALLGKKLSAFIEPDYQDTFHQYYRRALSTGARQICQVRLEKQDNTSFYAQLESKAADGGAQLLMVVTDIEARKQAEAALEEANARLEQRVSDRTAQLSAANGQLQSEIGERQQAEAKQLLYLKQLQHLASELNLTEERERKRIAADLHDHIGQLLSLAQMKLKILQAEPSAEAQADLANEVGALLEQMDEDLGSLTFDLCPPMLYELGLEAALEWLVGQFQTQYDLEIGLVDDEQPKPLEEDQHILLYRGGRELLLNVAKHAQTGRATLFLRRVDAALHLEVVDEGRGFDPAILTSSAGQSKGFGLFNLRERMAYIGGEMRLGSAPGKGTCCTLVVPLSTVGVVL